MMMDEEAPAEKAGKSKSQKKKEKEKQKKLEAEKKKKEEEVRETFFFRPPFYVEHFQVY